MQNLWSQGGGKTSFKATYAHCPSVTAKGFLSKQKKYFLFVTRKFTGEPMSVLQIFHPMERQFEAPRETARASCGLVPSYLLPLPLLLQVVPSYSCTCNTACTSIFLCTCTNCKIQSTNYRHDPLIPKDKRKCEQLLNQVL